MTCCAAVLVDPKMCLREPGNQDTFICEFKKRLLLQDITEAELRREKNSNVVIAKSARMRVKIV
jgi:hypothetical protein